MEKQPMRKDEIKALCAQNEAIGNAFKKFREQYPGYHPILDMYAACHFVLPIDEVTIIYLTGWRENKVTIETDLKTGQTKIIRSY